MIGGLTVVTEGGQIPAFSGVSVRKMTYARIYFQKIDLLNFYWGALGHIHIFVTCMYCILYP